MKKNKIKNAIKVIKQFYLERRTFHRKNDHIFKIILNRYTFAFFSET